MFQRFLSQVPLLALTWQLCAVAPWLRAPRSLDEARGLRRPDTAGRPPGPYGGSLPAVPLDEENEERAAPPKGKTKGKKEPRSQFRCFSGLESC